MQHGFVVVGEKISQGHVALATPRGQPYLGVERQERHRWILVGVGMRQGTTTVAMLRTRTVATWR